jgi:hypothetical protein
MGFGGVTDWRGACIGRLGKALFEEGHDDGWWNDTVRFDEKKMGIAIMTNSSNGERIYKELLGRLLGNTFTSIEWEHFTPYNALR